jgi:hypothetical protein
MISGTTIKLKEKTLIPNHRPTGEGIERLDTTGGVPYTNLLIFLL